MKNAFFVLGFLLSILFSIPQAMGQDEQEDPYTYWAMKANAEGFNFNDSLAIQYYYKAFEFGKPDKYALSGMMFSYIGLEEVDSAFLYLEKAVEAGFDHYDRLEGNIQCDLLKKSQPERFQKIIDLLKKKEREALAKKGYNVEVYYLLDSLKQMDQRVRTTLMNPRIKLTDDQRDSVDWVFRQVEAAGVEALQKIIEETGSVPTISMVGKKGESNAWVLVQHADHYIGFQKQYLQLLKEVSPEDVSLDNIAYLTDRVLTSEGKPQLYGTQIGLPIFEPEKVDERRAKYGLGTLDEYLRQIGVKP